MKKNLKLRLSFLALLWGFFSLQVAQAQCPSGINWTSRTSAADNQWQSVAYGNGLFVAVANSGTGNRVMTSPDGITWTSRSAAADNDWRSVTYGNGLFVAVATSGNLNRVMTSLDGITWATRYSQIDNDFMSVTTGHGLFVAVSTAISSINRSAIFSNNGITWGSANLAANNQWQSVTYGNGLFVAVSSTGTGNKVMISGDGVHWNTGSSASDNQWQSVTYGNGLFVAVANSGTGNRVMTSPDGITWTSRTSASDNQWQSVTYGNGLFVAVAASGTGNRIMTSPDGITWTSRTSAANNGWTSVTYGNGVFVAVAASGTGNRVMTGSPPLVSSVSIASNSGNSITMGTSVTFTATPTNGGTTPAYQWKKNYINVGSNSVTYTDATLENGDIISCVLTSNNPCASPVTAISGEITMAVFVTPTVSIVANPGNSITTGASVTFTATPTNGGTTPAYQWKKNNNNVGSNSITYTDATLQNGDIITCVLTSNNPIASPVTATSAGITMAVFVTPTVSIVANPGNSITTGASVTFTATPTNGGTTPAYQWKKNNNNVGSNSITYTDATLENDDIITCVLTSNNPLASPVTATSAGITMAVSYPCPSGSTWSSRTSAADNQWKSVTYGNGLFVAVSNDGTGNRVMTSPDGITWTSRTSAANISWQSVTFGNGLFVAVASGGVSNGVMTSPDGITWTIRTSAAANGWYSVTYGNGLFVAVAGSGNGDRVMTSPNGITWTIRTTNNNFWRSVTYGNGVFVAVASSGTDNRVMTSPDGITWTIRTSAADNSWISVTYGNGIFVAVAQFGTGKMVMTSPDGITWTSSTSAAANAWTSVTYGNGSFVAVSNTGTGNRVMTSPDGITWTSRTSAADNDWQSVTYSNGVFVAVSSTGTGNRVMTSSPPLVTPSVTIAANPGNSITTSTSVTFTATPTNGGTTPAYQWKKNNNNVGSNSVTYTDAILQNGDIITCVLTSNNPCASTVTATSSGITMAVTYPCPSGTTWVSRTSAADNAWRSITYGNGVFVAVSQDGTGNRVMTSPNGVTWKSQSQAADNSWISVTYGNGLFVAVASSGTGNRVMTSSNGINWTYRTSALDNAWQSVTYGNGLFVAVATSGTGNRVMTSPDGITWTSRTSAADNAWRSVTYGNGLFVAVSQDGTNNSVMTSPNGITWTSRSQAVSNDWMSVAYGNGLFVAVSQSGTSNRVMTSPDGITWTSRTSAADNQWQSVTYGNGLFVAVAVSGTNNRVMTSPDGITWTSRNSAADNQWSSITYGNGVFVAVSTTGTGNRVMTSSSPFTTSTTNKTICSSQLPYNWNGSRAAAGTYIYTTTNSQGCDSIATLNLIVKTSSISTTNVSISPSALPYSWNGIRTSAGTYTYTTTNSVGCDSVATLNLTVNQSSVIPLGIFKSYPSASAPLDGAGARAIATDAQGNIYQVGYYYFTGGASGFFIVKYNPAGVVQWEKKIVNSSGSSNDCLAIATSGTSVYITGKFFGTASFAGASGSNILTSAGGSDIFIAKYDGAGNCIWAKRAGGTANDIGYGIAANGSSVYITGGFQETANFNTPSATGSNEIANAGLVNIFVAKYDDAGNYQWAKRAGGTNSNEGIGNGIAVNGSSVYITGYFTGTANFNTPSATGSNEITSAGGNDIFIAKYDDAGNYQWAKRAGGTNTDVGNSIAVNGSSVYITGSFAGTANFNTPTATGSNEITSAGGTDIFVAKYDAVGNYQWVKRAGGTGGDVGNGIVVNGTSVYVTGYFNGTANFNTPTATLINEITSAGSSDVFIAKFDASGNYQWAKRGGGSLGDFSYGIATTATSVYITGTISGSIQYAGANFNTPSASGSNEIGTSGSAAFLAEYIVGVPCATTGTFTVSACNSYTWAAKGNKVYTVSNNTDTIVLVNAAGCDSVVTLNLTINSATSLTNSATACGSYLWNGVTYTTSGTYTKTFTGGNSKGCDSTATLNLTITNPLDNIGLACSTNSPVAYSLRKLSSGYAGSAIQVRRSGDDAIQDIGFTSNGDLDTASLKTFVGLNNGFVSIWYDQSGNATNLTQTTTTNQPRIVNAGVIDVENGKPFIRFFGVVTNSRNSLDLASGLSTNGQIVAVNKFASGGDGFLLGAASTYYWHSGPSSNLFSSAYVSTSINNATVYQNRVLVSSSTAVWNTTLSINSIAPQTPATGTFWDNIGSDRGILHVTTGGGGYAELLSFPTALSATDRQAVEASQTAYYSIGTVTWVGTTSTAWATASNWSTNAVPTSSSFVTIPPGTTFAPNNAGTVTVASLTVASGVTVTNTSTMNVTGALSNSGIITGTVILNGSSAQTIFGTGSITNLTLNNSAGATISSGTLNITGTLTPFLGTLSTNGNLILKSSITNTAIVGVVGGNVSGNVTVERYIPSNNRKKYVLVTSPVTSTINVGWQEAGATISGYGTHITNNQTTNGFDGPTSSLATIFTYDDTKAAGTKWTALASTTTAASLAPGKGYLLFVRGDRAENRPVTGNSSNTTLRATGTVGYGVLSPSLLTGASKYTLIANPYPSTIDWLSSGITKTNLQNAFTVYDSNLGVFVSSNGTNKTPSVGNQQAGYIQSGQAFFVQNNASGNGAITFTEAAKTTAANTASVATVFGEGASNNNQQLNINAYRALDNVFVDGVVALFGKIYNAAVDTKEDIAKFTNFNETFGLLRNSSLLGLEARPPITATDTLYCNLNNFGKRDYKLVIQGSNFSNTTATLEDAYTHTKHPINLADTIIYNFTINTDSASAAKNRFMITFGSTAPVTVADATGLFVKMSPNPVGDELQVSFKKATAEATSIVMLNSLGQVVTTVNAGNVSSGIIRIVTSALAEGVYTVQLQSGGKTIAIQKIVKSK